MNNYEQGVWIQLGEHSPAPPLRFQNSFSIALKEKKTYCKTEKKFLTLKIFTMRLLVPKSGIFLFRNKFNTPLT